MDWSLHHPHGHIYHAPSIATGVTRCPPIFAEEAFPLDLSFWPGRPHAPGMFAGGVLQALKCLLAETRSVV